MMEKKAKPLLPIILVVVGVLFLLGAIAWVVYFASPVGVNESQIASEVVKIPFPQVPRVSIATAKDALDNGSATFLDVRGSPYFEEGHIPGALSIPEDEIASGAAGLLKDDWIITYCT